MLQRLFQIVFNRNVLNADGSNMPGMQCIIHLPQSLFNGSRPGRDLKEQDTYKRPWYTPTLHC